MHSGLEKADREPNAVPVPQDLVIDLPIGWVEHINPGGPKEYRPSTDGSTGLLQVSEMAASYFEYLSDEKDLGAFAARLGAYLSTHGETWGRSTGSKQGVCALGRFGFAAFEGGEYPAMLLWVTVSSTSALLWTWLGPSLLADEIGEALQIVMNARRTPQVFA